MYHKNRILNFLISLILGPKAAELEEYLKALKDSPPDSFYLVDDLTHDDYTNLHVKNQLLSIKYEKHNGAEYIDILLIGRPGIVRVWYMDSLVLKASRGEFIVPREMIHPSRLTLYAHIIKEISDRLAVD